jgi:hypothetical protein
VIIGAPTALAFGFATDGLAALELRRLAYRPTVEFERSLFACPHRRSRSRRKKRPKSENGGNRPAMDSI